MTAKIIIGLILGISVGFAGTQFSGNHCGKGGCPISNLLFGSEDAKVDCPSCTKDVPASTTEKEDCCSVKVKAGCCQKGGACCTPNAACCEDSKTTTEVKHCPLCGGGK